LLHRLLAILVQLLEAFAGEAAVEAVGGLGPRGGRREVGEFGDL